MTCIGLPLAQSNRRQTLLYNDGDLTQKPKEQIRMLHSLEFGDYLNYKYMVIL